MRCLASLPASKPVLASRRAGVAAAPLPGGAGLLARKQLLVVRAAPSPSEAKDAANAALQKGKDAAKAGLAKAQSVLGNFEMPALPNIKTDITALVRINFIVQVVLTAVSWSVVFLSTHAGLAKGHNINIATVFLMLGVLLSAFSAFLSFGYFRKVQATGIEVMEGMAAMDNAFEHMKINFIGLAFTLVAMQAEIGTLFVTTVANTASQNYSSIAAMAQAGCNIFTAHAVSLLFLTLIIQKISLSTKAMVEWSEKMRSGLMGAISAAP